MIHWDDRGPQACPAGPDHHHVVLVRLVARFDGHQKTILGSRKTFIATRRTPL